LENVRQRAKIDAQAHGYYLNSDPEFLGALLEGLRVNEERYGFPTCPCRVASGMFEVDRDIICPCDYRDPDVEEHGACFCCLYVDQDTYESGEVRSIPERRPMEKQLRSLEAPDVGEGSTREAASSGATSETGRKLLYCRQCGYVVFREEPPYVCPICRAKQEMFAEVSAS
jgi:ferredoxin-thioredoxin reductase catalytic chain